MATIQSTSFTYVCGHCGVTSSTKPTGAHPTPSQELTTLRDQYDRHKADSDNPPQSLGSRHHWYLVCPHCEGGTVMRLDNRQWPPAITAHDLTELEGNMRKTWQEALAAFSVSAFTASEIMCRKLLAYAAEHNPQPGTTTIKPRATFADYIDALVNSGAIPAPLRPAIDQIRINGNEATHDLTITTPERAEQTLQLTEHLLKTMFILPKRFEPKGTPEP